MTTKLKIFREMFFPMRGVGVGCESNDSGLKGGGGLNEIILGCLFLLGCCVACSIYSSLWPTFLCPKAL